MMVPVDHLAKGDRESIELDGRIAPSVQNDGAAARKGG